MAGLVYNVRQIAGRVIGDIKSYRIALICIIIYNVTVRSIFHAFCPFLITTGFPCAGCGMTRAVFYLLTGRFSRAVRLNPAAPLWLIFILWFMYNRYVKGKMPKKTLIFLGIVCVVSLMIYIWRMVNFFPSDPPLVYYRNNIAAKMIKIIGN